MYGGVEFAGGIYAGPRAVAAASQTHPTLAVEVSFTTGAFETPAWVDITPDVKSWNVARGRGRELERFQPGRATIILNNLSRDYDSQNADGPWFGFLRPMRRIRIRETFDGVTHPTFDGYVDGWNLDYPLGGKNATATVIATDAQKSLAHAELLSVYEYEVRADEPVAWWRLGNPADESTGADWAGTRNLTYVDSPKAGEALVSRDPNQSTFFDHPDEGSGNVAEAAVSTPISAYPFTIEAVFRSDKQTDTLHRTILEIAGNNDGGGHANRLIDLFISDNVDGVEGEFSIVISDDQFATGSFFGSSGVRVDDKRIHHVVVSFWASNDVELWIDGVFTGLGGVSKASVALPTGTVQVALGNVAANYPSAGEFGLDGSLQDVAIYDAILPDARIAVHADAALHAWQGDLPGERLNRVLDVIEWPADLRSIDAGTTTFQSAETAAKPAVEHAHKTAETEYGLFFATRDGLVRLVDRAAVFARTSQATFGDDPSNGEIGYREIKFDDGDQTIRNRATISRLTGAAKKSVAPSSVTEFGPSDYTLEGLLHDSDSFSQDYADAITAEYSVPRRRVTSLTLGPAAPEAAAVLYPQMLGRELGDVVTVLHRPPGGGDPFEQECVIDAISHSGSPGGAGRMTTWSLSPVPVEEF